MQYSFDYINDNFLFETPVVSCEAGLLFGAGCASGEVARHAADLFHRGAFKSLVLAGGNRVFQPLVGLAFVRAAYAKPTNPDFWSPRREARYMRQQLLKARVPESAIHYVEDRSENTGENVTFCEQEIRGFSSMNLVCLASQQRRTMGVMRKYFSIDEMVLTTSGVYPFGVSKDNWADKKFFRNFVFGEAYKLDGLNVNNHVSLGYCEGVDVEAEIAAAATLPTFDL